MDLALDAAQARNLPDFLRNFAERAGRMLESQWSAVAVYGFGQEETQLYSNAPGQIGAIPAGDFFAKAILDVAAKSQEDIFILPFDAPEFPAQRSSGLNLEAIVVRIDSSEGERLGCICLLRKPQPVEQADRRLLQALASHAALSLVNFRRFSQLENSKRQWVEDIDAITDYIVVHDRSWRILRTNRSLSLVLGAEPAALVGQPMNRLRAISGSGSSLPCPLCRDPHRDREEFMFTADQSTFLVSTSRTSHSAEKDERTIHVLKDITDRLEAERRYRDLFNSIQEGLFFATPEGRFVDVNDAMVTMLGYSSRRELLLADVSSHLYPDPGSRKRVLQALAHGGVLRNHEETLRRKDGSLLHTLQNLTAVLTPRGEISQIRGLMLDVTEQRLFQAQLQRERDFNQKILNTTQSMILVLDTAGLISYANRRCYDVGYRESDLIGHRLVEWVEPNQRREFDEALRLTAQGHQMENIEIRLRRSDASMGHFSVSFSPMRDEQAVVNNLVVVMTDITDATILHAKLAHSEKMATLGQLVSGVAHEVNNPLAAILGFTDLLLENPNIPEDARGELRIILQETQRTKVIVQDLLSFARQRPARREPVQLNTVLRQTIKLRNYDFESHGVELIESLQDNLGSVLGDPQQLQQVFLNILNNAYDAVQEAGRPGRIEVRSSRIGQEIEIAVTDNGNGVADPVRIFDPFYTTKPPGKGTGLGLSICYGIMKAHNGEILCWNNAEGAGCTFIVRVPVSAEPAAASAAMEAGR